MGIKFEEELTPIEKFKTSLGLEESLFEKGFMTNWLMLFVYKIVKKAGKGSFDFDKLHRTEKNMTYEENFPKFKKYLDVEMKKKNPKKIYFIVIDYLSGEYLIGAWLMSLSYIM